VRLVLKVTYQTARFLARDIHEAMRSGDLTPMVGEGGVVEVDETFIDREQIVEGPRRLRPQAAADVQGP
jgi:hypothetical protein